MVQYRITGELAVLQFLTTLRKEIGREAIWKQSWGDTWRRAKDIEVLQACLKPAWESVLQEQLNSLIRSEGGTAAYLLEILLCV